MLTQRLQWVAALCAATMMMGGTAARAQDDECGGALTPADAVKLEQQMQAGLYALPEAALGTVYTVPIRVHLVRRSDGSGAASYADITAAIDDTNDLWAPIDIQFCIVGPIIYHDSDLLYDFVGTTITTQNLFTEDNSPHAIDMYFVHELGPWCGVGTFTWLENHGVAIDFDCISGELFAHELGHYFDLLHTHETANGVECPDGSNCATAGDLVCDTEADPNSWSDCSFAGAAIPDGCSGTYAPDSSNIMSYAPRACRDDFTSGQVDRARATLLNLRDEELLSDPAPCAPTAPCPGTGGCFEANGTPGCTGWMCCELVCDIDPFCCENNWDSLCAEEAAALCTTCGETGAGNCYDSQTSFGCSDADCCRVVCAIDFFCCTAIWDADCAALAIEICTNCGEPGAGPCDTAHGTPGCSDPEICAAVCEILPLCCDAGWGAPCVGLAIELGFIDPGAGDECETAPTITDGTTPVTLGDNSGSGDDSTCGVNDQLDEWYRYVAMCDGTAAAGVCTEFSTVQIVISVYDECQGTEVACSTSDVDCSFGNGARATWTAVAGEDYYIRISGENATIVNNFSGTLLVDCEGCGAPDAGNCYASNGSPFCNDGECCAFVCEIDSYCCDTTWDTLCGAIASENCVYDCGGAFTGDCYHANATPFCESAGCCETVCAIDPYCCDVRWDSICAGRAEDLCFLTALDTALPFIPAGDATLSLSGSDLIVGNIGIDFEDGARLRAASAGELEAVVLDMTPLSAPGFASRLGIETDAGPGGQASVLQGGIGTLYDDGDYVIYVEFEYGTGVPFFYDARVALNGDVVHEWSHQSLIVGSASTRPNTYATELLNGSQLEMVLRWNAPTTLSTFDGVFVVDEVAVVSTSNTPPLDGDFGLGSDLPTPVVFGATDIDEVRALAAGYASFRIDGGSTEVPCRGDINDDDVVNVADLLLMLGAWGAADLTPEADVAPPGGDGSVNVTDLLQLLGDWGPCPT